MKGPPSTFDEFGNGRSYSIKSKEWPRSRVCCPSMCSNCPPLPHQSCKSQRNYQGQCNKIGATDPKVMMHMLKPEHNEAKVAPGDSSYTLLDRTNT